MPTIPTYTAQTTAVPAQYTSHGGSGVPSGDAGIASGFSRLAAGVKSISDALQSQSQSNSTAEMIGGWNAGVKDIQMDLQSNPVTANDPMKWQQEYDKRAKDLQQELEKKSYNGNSLMRFREHVALHGPMESLRMKHEGNVANGIQQYAKALEVGDTTAKAAAIAETPEEQRRIMNIYTSDNPARPGALEDLLKNRFIDELKYRKEKEAYTQKVLSESASILTRTPEGREKFYANTEAGVYNNLDPNKLSILTKNANEADIRAEGAGRANEKRNQAAHEDREIEIGTLIDKGQFSEAKSKLELYADLRVLKPNVIEKLRKSINDPAIERVSNSAISSRIGLDVIGTNPKTTMAEIDAAQAAHSQGMPGLSLADATKYKLELRNTLNALQDKTKSVAQRDQTQVEQLLRADFGIRADLIQSAMHENPNLILYSQFLRELTNRSNAFYGNENPMDVYNSMKPRINSARGETGVLQPEQLKSLYPDWQSLEKARDRNNISEDVYQKEVNRRKGLPAPGVPSSTTPGATTTPTPTKRKSGNF